MTISLTESAWKKLGYKVPPSAAVSHAKRIRGHFWEDGKHYLTLRWRFYFPLSEVVETDKSVDIRFLNERDLAKYRKQLVNALDMSKPEDVAKVRGTEVTT